jgi:hypothetical protein
VAARLYSASSQPMISRIGGGNSRVVGRMKSRVAVAPPVSKAMERITKLRSSSSALMPCQTGRSKRHPHHEAHDRSKTLRPA